MKYKGNELQERLQVVEMLRNLAQTSYFHQKDIIGNEFLKHAAALMDDIVEDFDAD